jgi:hypothetical protein
VMRDAPTLRTTKRATGVVQMGHPVSKQVGSGSAQSDTQGPSADEVSPDVPERDVRCLVIVPGDRGHRCSQAALRELPGFDLGRRTAAGQADFLRSIGSYRYASAVSRSWGRAK